MEMNKEEAAKEEGEEEHDGPNNKSNSTLTNSNLVDELDDEEEEQLRLELARGLKISHALREEECVKEKPIPEEKELIEGDISLRQLLKLDVSYRELRKDADDVEALVSLEYLSFGEDGWDLNQFKLELSEEQSGGFVAEMNETVIGFVCFSVFKEANPPHAEITNLVVEQSCRCMGIGTRLLEEVRDKLKKEGVKHACLHVSTTNTSAINLYKKFEFKVESKLSDYYGEGLDAYFMTVEFKHSR